MAKEVGAIDGRKMRLLRWPVSEVGAIYWFLVILLRASRCRSRSRETKGDGDEIDEVGPRE